MAAATTVMSCELDYVVRGDHVHRQLGALYWRDFGLETSNPHDLYSAAVFHREGGIVGHLPRAISRVCSSFDDNSIPIVKCPQKIKLSDWMALPLELLKIVAWHRGTIIRRAL